MAKRKSKVTGFTLLELMVVVGLIVLLASLIIPSTLGMFNAGSASQAYNIFAAQLSAARALAIRNGHYAGLHCGLASPTVHNGEYAGQYYIAPVEYSTAMNYQINKKEKEGAFYCAPGYVPLRPPGNMVFGHLGPREFDPDTNEMEGYVDPNTDKYLADALNDPDYTWDFTDPKDPLLVFSPTYQFLDFTIVFSGSGQVVTKMPTFSHSPQANMGQPPGFIGNLHGNVFYMPSYGNLHSDPLFFRFKDDTALWDGWIATKGPESRGWPGRTAVTMFDFTKFEFLDGTGRATYLNENGLFLPININTGQIFPRK